MWKYLPENKRDEFAENDEEAKEWLDATGGPRQTDAQAPARAVDARQRRARDLHRGQGGPRHAARRRLPRHQLSARRARQAEAARACTTSSRTSPTWTSRRTPMEVGPTTHYAMGGIRVDPDTGANDGPGPVRARARSPAACTARTGSAGTRSRT